MKSLICNQGRDGRIRTAVIGVALSLIFLLYVALFIHATPLVRIVAGAILALPCAAVVLASARRRLNDSGKPLNLAYGPLLFWVLMAAAQLASPYSIGSLGLNAFFLASMLGLAALPASGLRARFAPGDQGHWGYSGPVDLSALSEAPATGRQRVEPSMDGSAPAAPAMSDFAAADEAKPEFHGGASYWDDAPKNAGVGEAMSKLGSQLMPLIQRQWKALSAVTGVVVVAVLLLTFWPESAPQQQQVEVPEPALKPSAPAFEHSVTMPDTYELLMNHDGIIVKWPGDTAPQGELWSLLTARGDRSCTEMRFNNNNRYRAVKVEVWPDDMYYAYFSPLDTSDIVYDVAMRGSFSLCGYDFGLRGSMDTLRAHPAFALYTRR
ncbi:hypothetical protein KUV89_03300 [Marinobacter hydrocarbonoclasticus]|nr:hypothetical protein [Marinobacter nauticus]